MVIFNPDQGRETDRQPPASGAMKPDDELKPITSILVGRLRELLLKARRGTRPFDRCALALVGGQLAMAAWVVAGGSFYLDDLKLQSLASRGLTVDYLLSPGSDHLAPGVHLLAWLETAAAPLDHAVAVVVQLSLLLLGGLLFYRLARRLWGPVLTTLLPMTVYALSTVTLPVDAWWIQSLCLLPVQATMAGALLAHVRYLQSGERRWGYLGAAVFAAGLLFWESATITLLLVVLLTTLYFPARRGLRAVAATGTRHAKVAAAYLGVIAGYAVLYVTQGHGLSGGEVSALAVLEMLGNQLGRTLLPALIGGPWSWRTGGSYYGLADPVTFTVVLAAVLAAAVVLVSVVRSRDAWRGWVVFVACFAANFGMIAYGRLGLVGPDVGRDFRYVAVLAVPSALSIGLALLPLPRGTTLAGSAPAPRHDRRTAWMPQRVATRLGVALLALSTLVSAARFANAWHRNPVGSFLANAASDLAGRRDVVDLYDTTVPNDVLPGRFYPWNTASRVLAPIAGSVRFNDARLFFMLLDEDGHVVGTRFDTSAVDVPGPSGKCGYAITPTTESVRVPLDSTVPVRDHLTMRVEFIAAAPTSVALWAGDGSRRVPITVNPSRLRITRGLDAVVVQVPPRGSAVDAVVAGPFRPSTYVCVTSVQVGVPVPNGFPVTGG